MFNNRILHLYTDVAPEIVKAGKSLRTCHDTSTPYRSATNGIASGRLGMSWRAPGRCLSIPGCQLPIGFLPAVAFVITRIYAWWKVIVLCINATSRGTLNEK